jgi:hypothetical protein
VTRTVRLGTGDMMDELESFVAIKDVEGMRNETMLVVQN